MRNSDNIFQNKNYDLSQKPLQKNCGNFTDEWATPSTTALFSNDKIVKYLPSPDEK